MRGTKEIFHLQLFLRISGSVMLLALAFVFVPRSWMKEIHLLLELGEMPDAPIVWYLARSTSAFYALAGALFWLVSFDVRAQQRILLFLGPVTVLVGVVLLGIDVAAGMPAEWTVTEGPFVVVFGFVLIYLVYRVDTN